MIKLIDESIADFMYTEPEIVKDRDERIYK